MRHLNRLEIIRFLVLGCFLMSSAAFAEPAATESEAPKKAGGAEAQLMNAKGEKVGEAILTESNDGVLVSLRVSGLTPGLHGIHFHERGKCNGPDFKSAGDHFRPDHKEHGLDNPKGSHAGDLPNLEVGEDGTATAEMRTKRVTLGRGSLSLFKKGGTALVIHAEPDDQKTSPSGNSGARIACGVIKRN